MGTKAKGLIDSFLNHKELFEQYRTNDNGISQEIKNKYVNYDSKIFDIYLDSVQSLHMKMGDLIGKLTEAQQEKCPEITESVDKTNNHIQTLGQMVNLLQKH